MTRTSTAPPPSLKAPITFITGKGGVGKTTIAAALAVHAARQGQSAALIEFEDGEAGIRALGDNAKEVEHIVLTYDRALLDTLGNVLGARLLAKAIVSHGALKRLIRAIPALREFTYLDRIRDIVDKKRYDRVIVDLPASGHALDWLRVPIAFNRFLGKSPLGFIGRRIHDSVVAPGRCEIVVVTLAEPLVVKETEQLCKRLRKELSLVPSLVVVNRTVVPDPEGAWEAAQSLAENVPHLTGAARDFSDILRARGDQADDTAYAFGLARALEAEQVVSVPEAAHDPSAVQVADWLFSGAHA